MQQFAEYLQSHNPQRKDREWAEVLGVSRSHLNMLKHGKAQPSKRLMLRIERATGGAVPLAVWFENITDRAAP